MRSGRVARPGVLVEAVALVGAALLGAACGGSSGDGSGQASAAAPSAASSVPSSAAATPSVTASVTASSGTSATTSATGTATGAGPGPCDVLTGAEVAAALGGSGAAGHRILLQSCVYPGSGERPRLLVRLADAGGARQGPPGFERVAGLGDWAGWYAPTKTLSVIDRNEALGLVYLGPDLAPDDARKALAGLARRALDRL